MALVKTEAVILRSMKLGETSKLLTLYSRKGGLIKLIAKGARQAKSRTGGTLEPLNVIEAVYYDKKTRELQILSQASLIHSPKFIFFDSDRTVLALACGEMITRLETTGHANPGAYRLLQTTIEALDQQNVNDRLIFFAFQLRLLQCLGFLPNLRKCVVCSTNNAINCKFDFANARLYCSECSGKASHGLPVATKTVNALRDLGRLPVAKAGSLDLPPATQADVYRFLKAFYQYHLEELGILKSIEVLKKMKSFADTVLHLQETQKPRNT